MDMFLSLLIQLASKQGDQGHFSQFERSGDSFSSKFGQVVFERMADLFEQAVFSQAFEHTGDLLRSFVWQKGSNRFVRQAADIEFATNNGLEQVEVVSVEKIEATIAAAIFFDWAGDLFDVFWGRARIIDGGNEFQVTAVGGGEQIAQHGQRINVFAQRSLFHGSGSVTVFHLAVVLEKSDIINGSFNSKNQIEFVVHLDADRPHAVFNSGTHNASAEVIAHLTLVEPVNFAAQERSNVVDFYCMNGCSHQFSINYFQVALLAENDVGGIFGLHDAPMVIVRKVSNHRTVLPGRFIENAMHLLDIDVVGQFLGFVKVSDGYEGVVEHSVVDAFLVEFGRQLVMTIEIELQAKRCPGGYPQITQPQRRVDEVEVVMQTLATVIFEKCFVSSLVVPGLVAGAWLHRREDMHQAGMVAPLSQDFFDALLLAEVLFADEVYLETVLGSDAFSILSNFFSQRLGPVSVSENANVLLPQKQTNAIRITNTWNRSGQNNAIKTRCNAFYLRKMPFNEILHAQCLSSKSSRQLSNKHRAA